MTETTITEATTTETAITKATMTKTIIAMTEATLTEATMTETTIEAIMTETMEILSTITTRPINQSTLPKLNSPKQKWLTQVNASFK